VLDGFAQLGQRRAGWDEAGGGIGLFVGHLLDTRLRRADQFWYRPRFG
jgi:hypothetical protein